MKNYDVYEEWYKYNEKGDPSYYTNTHGTTLSIKNVYNANGILLSAHLTESSGFEEDIIYDENKRIIQREDSDGEKKYYEYDEKGNEIRFENEEGYIIWKEYDERGNCIHIEDNEGNKHDIEYDDHDNMIKETSIVSGEKYEFAEEYKYDERGNMIYHKDSDGCEESWEYKYNEDGSYEFIHIDENSKTLKKFDKNGNRIYKCYTKEFDDYKCEEWREYDKNNNCIHMKNSSGPEIWWDYNENGKIVHYKSVGILY